RPQRPVVLRVHLEFVPRAPFQTRSAPCQRYQAELAALAPQVTIQMRWMNVPVRTQFVHGGRLRGDVEGQPLGGLPDGDRLDERTGRKLAMPHGADSASLDGRPPGVGDSQFEIPRIRFGEIGKTDDKGPD